MVYMLGMLKVLPLKFCSWLHWSEIWIKGAESEKQTAKSLKCTFKLKSKAVKVKEHKFKLKFKVDFAILFLTTHWRD